MAKLGVEMSQFEILMFNSGYISMLWQPFSARVSHKSPGCCCTGCSLQLEVIADLSLGLLKKVTCDLKTQARATQNGSYVPAASEGILGRVHRKEVDCRVTTNLC